MNFDKYCYPLYIDPQVADWCKCTMDYCSSKEELDEKIKTLGLDQLMSVKESMSYWTNEQKQSFFYTFSSNERMLRLITEELESGWLFRLRPNQLIDLNGEWRTKIIQAGRGWGKSLASLYWLMNKIKENEGGPAIQAGLIVARLANGLENTLPELLLLFGDDKPTRWDKRQGILEWDKYNVKLFTLTTESPEVIRGYNFSFCLCDELANWANISATFNNVKFATRITVGDREPKILITTTPTNNPEYLEIWKDAEECGNVVYGKFFENCKIVGKNATRENLRLINTQKGRIELLAQMGNIDLPWLPSYFIFDADYDNQELLLELVSKAESVVIAVDPAMSTANKASETGIIAACRFDNKCFILEDGSGRYSPQQWSAKVALLAMKYNANYVVAETNHGHDLVLENLKNNDELTVPVKSVTASQGKISRAEPIITLHETERVIYAGSITKFRTLYEQCISYDPTKMSSKNGKSPDRHDAMVWAVHALMINKKNNGKVRVVTDQPVLCSW